MGPNQSSSCATGPRNRSRQDSKLVSIVLMLRVGGHTGNRGGVSVPRGRPSPTIAPVPTIRVSTLVLERWHQQATCPAPTTSDLHVAAADTPDCHGTVLPRRLQTQDNTILANIPTSPTDDIPDTEAATGALGPHFVGSPVATATETPQNALGPK